MNVIVWFRRDLRLDDNPALDAAVSSGRPIIPLFVFDDEGEGDWQLGGASKWWLHFSLTELSNSIETLGGKLLILKGDVSKVIQKVAEKHSVTEVFLNARYEPSARLEQAKVEQVLRGSSVKTSVFHGSILSEPGKLLKGDGTPYMVYGAFSKAFRMQITLRLPTDKPKTITFSKGIEESVLLEELSLLPKVNWDSEIKNIWTPGEKAARNLLTEFMPKCGAYPEQRNLPAIFGTSRLSPYLHFGEISPIRIFAELAKAREHNSVFANEILWREFAHHVLYFHPRSAVEPLRSEFNGFAWREDEKGLLSWQQGMTGYPIVDAGMRELWHLGWMHNRVRMIVGSFLVKDLMVPWQSGAKWFWDTLLDADLAANSMNWQWVAGCGVDAAPYFRIFNPILQGKKFDPDGEYVKKWVPELKALPKKWIHEPFNAPSDILAKSGITLGKDYPMPIVDHSEARERALSAFEEMSERKREASLL